MKKKVFSVLMSVLLLGSVALSVSALTDGTKAHEHNLVSVCSGSRFDGDDDVDSYACAAHSGCTVTPVLYYTYTYCTGCNAVSTMDTHTEYYYHSTIGPWGECPFDAAIASIHVHEHE